MENSDKKGRKNVTNFKTPKSGLLQSRTRKLTKRISGNSIYQKIKNLLTLILMKTSVLFQNDRNFETFYLPK